MRKKNALSSLGFILSQVSHDNLSLHCGRKTEVPPLKWDLLLL
jgi:hypothetical protein